MPIIVTNNRQERPLDKRSITARLAGSIIVLGLLCGTVVAQQQAEQVPEPFVVELNVNSTAENLLNIARTLAGDGAYADATNLYLEAMRLGKLAVTQVQPDYYLPMWRVLIDDAAAWPDEAQRQLSRAITMAAAGNLDQARQAGNLAQLEAAVQQYFLSQSGASATVLLADRFREKGWPALALYYYRLVLDRHPMPDISRQQVLVRVALAARAAGLDDMAMQAAAELREINLQMDVDPQTRPLEQWLENLASQLPPHGRHSAGHGNVSPAAAQPPAVILWESQIATPQRQQAHYAFQNITLNTPVAYPTSADGVTYVANGHSIWATDSADGKLKWKFDTRQTQDAPLPPVLQSQALQPLVSNGVVYVPLQDGEDGRQQQRGYGFASMLATNVYALSADDGRMLWHWNPRKAGLQYADLNVDGQPIVVGDTVVVSLNASSAFFGEVYIAGLSRADGSLLWSQPIAGYTQGMITRASARMYMMPTQVISNSLATRGGMVFSNGLGITAAHSPASGGILWARSMRNMMQAKGAPAPKDSGISNSLADHMGLSRMPRLLIGRHNLLTGCILSPNLESYHYLDGTLHWTRDAQGARHPVALTTDGHAVVWGSHVALVSMDDGQPLWTPYKPPAPIVGEPLITQQQILLPLPQAVLALDLKTGLLQHESELPPDIAGGNLALSPAGMIIVNHQGTLSFLDWQTAHGRFLDQADNEPDNPRPLLLLGQAAIRLRKTEKGITYLDRAMQRPTDEEQRVLIYYLYEHVFRTSRNDAGDQYLLSLLERMQKASGPTNTVGRNGFLRAEFFANRDPRQSIAALQSILDVDRSRDVIISGIVGTGISSVLAEEAIGRYIQRYGRQVYQPWEQLAAAARQAALEDADYDAMINVALRYPNSLSAKMALEDALNIALNRQDLNEADRLLLRISAVTADPARQARYRAMLAETSRQLGNHQFAAFQVTALRDLPTQGLHAVVPGGKRVPIADIMADIAAHQPAPPATEPEPADSESEPALKPVPEPPYRKVWQFDNDKWGIPRHLRLRDRRSPEKRDANTVLLGTERHIVALVPETGQVNWSLATNRAGNAYIYDHAIFTATGDELQRLDTDSGESIWRIKMRSSPAIGEAAPQSTLIGGLCYGQSGVEDARDHIMQLDSIGGYVIANGRRFSYLIDERDGYIVQTLGHGGNQHPGFLRQGDHMVSLTMQVGNIISGLQQWSIATGRVTREVTFRDRFNILGHNQPPSRIMPIMRNQPQRQVGLLDLKEGVILGWIASAGNVHQNNCRFTDDLVIMPTSNQVVAAFRVSTLDADPGKNTPLWSITLPNNTYLHTIVAVGDDRVAIYYNGGVKVVNTQSGEELWGIHNDNRFSNFQHLHADAERIIIMRSTHAPNNHTRNASIHDAATGKEIFRFEGEPPQQVAVTMLPGHPGMFVTRNNRDFEYWIHDPAGDITFDAEAAARKDAELAEAIEKTVREAAAARGN